LDFYAFRIIGFSLIILGLPGLLHSFLQFALKGFGTPAPVLPPQHLVVSGLYRYVRNPMYVSVISIVIGQALLFGNLRLLIYAAFVALFFHCFVVLYEEPKLRRTFPGEYETFCSNVPRWLPLLRPWKNKTEAQS
jgi:protein-S-isoprenylcysteine O-methyltransferase Ste14